MSTFRARLSLRTLLLADAATCVLMGWFLLLTAESVGRLTRIPDGLLFYAGAALIPIALFIGVTGARTKINISAVRVIILGNVVWVVGSILLTVPGWIAPNALGIGFIVAQAFAVALLTALEHVATMREAAAPPARRA